MIWIGLAIVVVTFYLIYKNYEWRSSDKLLSAQTEESLPLWMLSLNN